VPRYRRASPDEAPSGGPLLAVVGNPVLVRLARHFVLSHPGSRSVACGKADVVGFVGSNAVDLVLLDVDESVMAGFALAADLRAADRARRARGYAVLVAATTCECKYGDCLVGGSAINGVLKMPCDFLRFVVRVELWCSAACYGVGSGR
jgi:CheY-like chemotaxis protein